ncbi:MAG: DUF6661 family protein [Marvinbryantia sp.]|uniref:DUF6661 family protein n=1 Tax=Marvinbryantia sp. TaxID=2496532 RepID=UPI0025F652E1|nr:DUF6661 family protein [uncultured Marvinbryantia sp.]
MEIREESGLKFGFPDENIAIKFDDTKYYRDLFNALPGSKGVDFISAGKDAISFIEVKNCLGDEGNCRWRIFPNNQKRDTTSTKVDVQGRESLDIEVPQKVAMTLAALAGARSFGDKKSSLDELKEIITTVFSEDSADDTKTKYVILFLEGNFGGHTRTKKMIMENLQRSMNTKMRWLNCKVSVVDSSTYNKDIFQIVS